MPLIVPTLDDRRYQDLLDEALARIPISTPEWTNFNKSDPGVTLIEVFAFMTENLLYRSNQIPERNRRKFLSLLGIPLQTANSAQGLVGFNNERGALQTITLNNGVEVRAGQIPFRTQQGLDILPVEAQVYYKRKVAIDPQAEGFYRQLYASFLDPEDDSGVTPQLYETANLSPKATGVLDLGQDTIDGAIWIALLLRPSDKPYDDSKLLEARQAIGGKTLSLGVVPALTTSTRKLSPGGTADKDQSLRLQFRLPRVNESGLILSDVTKREPEYRLLNASADGDVLTEPGTVQITLPSESELGLWRWANLEPLEAGVGNFPPALEDTALNERVITWLRVSISDPRDSEKLASNALQAKFSWLGINATMISQRERVTNEVLPEGTGTPDQIVILSKTPVVPRTVTLSVSNINGQPEPWSETDDLLSAGSEVPVYNTPASNQPSKVFSLNPESGEIKFGDGLRGARPPQGAIIRAAYDYSLGQAGNVGATAINSSPVLPPGVTVGNPIPTRGGAASESVSEGEKQIARYLQHRDRLVNTADFETITLRTPGVEIGRVEVIPTYNPELGSSAPGDAPGAVTLMVIPRYDARQPDAPQPDQLFLDTICAYLDPRRLVTTEVFLRGPAYQAIWLSAGIQIVPGASEAVVREAVKQELLRFLSPLPANPAALLANQATFLSSPQYAVNQRGWQLRKAVVDLELVAIASRVSGVMAINKILIGNQNGESVTNVPMRGLELPRVAGIAVGVGEPLSLADLRGQALPGGTNFLPVPKIPEEC
jgi:Baseplate J-like protein